MKSGDYVLATKYTDAKATDPWYVGFYKQYKDGRHYVEGGRLGGYRSVRRITKENGDLILANGKILEQTGASLRSFIKSIKALKT